MYIRQRGLPNQADLANVLIAYKVLFVFDLGYAASAIPKRYTGFSRYEKQFDSETFVRSLFGHPI